MTTTSEMIAMYAANGIMIDTSTAEHYNAQRAAEQAQYDAVIEGGTWDREADRPYRGQYLCQCERHMATWAVETLVDGKPDRILFCTACVAKSASPLDVRTTSDGLPFTELRNIDGKHRA